MKRIATLLITIIALSGAVRAQTFDGAAGAAQMDLQQALKELDQARQRIAAEKNPMNEALTKGEQALVDRRKEQDAAARAGENIALEINNLKAEVKVREDELGYVSNLLDEFARNFETKLHLVERSRYSEALEAALLAPQSPDLDQQQKLARQLSLLQRSLERVKEQVGGSTFAGAAVSPEGTLEQGKVALIGPTALFAGERPESSGVLVSQAGGKQAVVRPLEKKDQNIALAAVVNSGEGVMPFDPTRGGALQALMQKASLMYYFKKGGPIMWPLLICSIVAVAVVIERVIFIILANSKRKQKDVDEIILACENGDVPTAMKIGEKSKDFIARALYYALKHRDKGLTTALLRSTAIEIKKFERGVFILDTIITMAPLLGLLGTVTGMMHSFGMMGGGDLGAPAAITGGIAEALIATAVGLGVALTCLLPMNYLHSQAEKAQHEIEDAAAHLELVMKPITDAESHLQHRELVARMERGQIAVGGAGA
jgi:biopolymer transport protein ExbB